MVKLPATFILRRNVAEEHIKQVYDVHIFRQTVETTVTKDPDIVAEWIRPLANGYIHRYIGFEMEFDTIFNHVGMMQFCDGERCLVIQMSEWPYLHPSIEAFLKDHRNVFVGSQVRFKMRWLKREGYVKNATSFICGQLHYRAGKFVVDLLALFELCGVEIGWTRRNNLSSQQVHYACARAYLNLHVLNYL